MADTFYFWLQILYKMLHAYHLLTYKNVINLMLHKFIIISFVYEVIGKTITEKCVTQKSFFI